MYLIFHGYDKVWFILCISCIYYVYIYIYLDGDWSKYHSTQANEIPYYKEWAKKYRILIYYGDVDAGVPYNES